MNISINWELVKDKTPAELEPEESLKYWEDIKHYCFHCCVVTTFRRCAICGKRYCSEHCRWDNDGTWEYPGYDYPICYHCD